MWEAVEVEGMSDKRRGEWIGREGWGGRVGGES